MKDSYITIHYNEEIRPYTKYPVILCGHMADKYFKARKGKLLDVCCGRGEHMEIFTNLGFDTYGVDREYTAKNKNLNVKIVDVESEAIPFEDNFFDFIMIKSAVEHIRNIYHLMENVFRVLKPGGKIVILTSDWKIHYKVFYEDIDHKTPFTRVSLYDLLLRYDFKNVDVQDFYHLRYTWKNKFLQIIPRIIAFLMPVDIPPNIKLNFFTKLVKFSREKQLLAYGEK